MCLSCVPWSELLKGDCYIRDLYRGRSIGVTEGDIRSLDYGYGFLCS